MAGQPFTWNGPMISPHFATSEAQLVAGIDASQGNSTTVVLTAARVVGAPANGTAGQRLSILFIQDGTGGRNLTWNAIFKGVSYFNTGNTANRRTIETWVFDGMYWNQEMAPSGWLD